MADAGRVSEFISARAPGVLAGVTPAPPGTAEPTIAGSPKADGGRALGARRASSRVKDWPERLALYLRERETTPFGWGWHDCCRFTCLGVAVQGLPDPMPWWARRYSTAAGALGAIARVCALDPSAGAPTERGDLDTAATILAARAGLEEIAPLFARRGDPVLADVVDIEGRIGPALGLAVGATAAFADPVRGLRRFPLAGMRRAWRVE